MNPTEENEQPESPRRAPRRWRWALGGLLALVGVACLAVALVPFWLGTESGRRYLLNRANAVLSPATLEVDRFAWSWFQPTTMTGFRLRDAQGQLVVDAPRANWDRNLHQALFDPLRLGTLELGEGTAIDLHRDADGKVNLVEALRPVLSRDPRTQLAIRVVHGKLAVESPELLEPIKADDLNLTLDKPAAPEPATFAVDLAGPHPQQQGDRPSLKIEGSLAGLQPGTTSSRDLNLKLDARDWPLHLAGGTSKPNLHTALSGQVDVSQKLKELQASGSLTLAKLEAEGGLLRGGDRLRASQPVEARWKVLWGEQGLDAQELDIKSAELNLHGKGNQPAEGPPRVDLEGTLDLAALATQLPHTLGLQPGTRFEKGTLGFGVASKPEGTATTWTARGHVDDLVAVHDETRLALSEPLQLEADLVQGPGGLDLRQFGMSLKGVKAKGSGDLERGIHVEGDIDLAALDAPVRELVGLSRIDLAGSGPFSLDYARHATDKSRYRAGVSVQLKAEVETTPVAQRVVARPVLASADRVPPPPAPGAEPGAPPPPPLPAAAPFQARPVAAAPAPAAGALAKEARSFLLEANLEGPIDGSGLPRGLLSGKGKLTVEQGALQVHGSFDAAGSNGELQSLAARLTGSVPAHDQALQVDLDLATKREPAQWSISQARVALARQQPGAAAQPQALLDLAARGTYQPETKTLHLVPLESANAGPGAPALALAPEGMTASNLGTSQWRVDLSLAGDAAGLPHEADSPLPTLLGRWTGKATVTPKPDGAGWNLAVSGQSNDLALGGANRPPTAIGPLAVEALASGGYNLDSRIDVPSLSLDSRFLRLEANGQLDDPMRRRLVTVDGQFGLKWAEVNALLQEKYGPDARIAGRSRPFFVRGPLGQTDESASQPITAEVGINLDVLEARGLVLGNTPIVAQLREGQVKLAQIDGTLNEGRIVAQPLLQQDTDGRWILSLAPGARIENAVLNVAMTHGVLSYVAPPLDSASRISGKLSALFDRVTVPLGEGLAEDAVVEGQIVFHDVVFGPGPLALALYRALNAPPANIELDQPVVVAIHDGLIEQRGFSFPLGDAGRVTLDGNVGFDRSLDMIGSIGLAGERFANVPVFNQIAPTLRLEVPIRGSLDDPQVDARGIGKSAGRMGLNAAASAGLGGLEALFDVINRPPPTPEEAARMQAEREARRAEQRLRQQQKQEERRLKREQRRGLRNP